MLPKCFKFLPSDVLNVISYTFCVHIHNYRAQDRRNRNIFENFFWSQKRFFVYAFFPVPNNNNSRHFFNYYCII